ncbi:hypothetical protein B0T10DRAFT_222577 [Thelonectria olida]|uniref:Calcium permeable stress-gated cation channel 1 n=1 Tax=Thelonectria olida TaxID=1576542 RepID=A0A9P8WD20_9HYPO|nr:hypothetical protein B0T10DRAFT_222577 [Thelonectria olida]
MQSDDPENGCRDGDLGDSIRPQQDKSLQVQLVLSLVIGVSAFLAFVILRPRWPALYAARKRRLDAASNLPPLSDSAFGWIPQLYKVTEEQVLASAGLDAFVFLTFFKMAIRLFSIMAFFATVVLLPINKYCDNFDFKWGANKDVSNIAGTFDPFAESSQIPIAIEGVDLFKGGGNEDKSMEKKFLWSYVLFTYFFVALTVYFVNWDTFRIIRYRQEYLGSQSTVTDRTFRLTGIPSDQRSEEQIKAIMEKLNIGTVDSVIVCRDWKKLDDLVELRDKTLRKLETAWAQYVKYQRDNAKGSNFLSLPGSQSSSNNSARHNIDEESAENGHLLDPERDQTGWDEEGRPQVRLRYGFFGLRFRNIDAIDYYEEKLRRLDAEVVSARKKKYTPTDMAIVTMDSVASCQMIIQARIDPRPGRLLTKPTPAPSDLVWRNTYAPRGLRRLKSWTVTIFITFLTLVWIFPTAFLASLMSLCTVNKALPKFAAWLKDHAILLSLFQNGVPTLTVSLLNVAVPYLYDWLSNCQGMISQGDVELSVISKNFFFTFFNTFFVFAISRTGLDFLTVLRGFLKDTSKIPIAIARDVNDLAIFYTCFIMLQGIGLMPFRILEVGSVFLYPFSRIMSKTPRDFAELKQPPVFQYGFFLPTSLLVFNLCLIYSVLTYGFVILIMGTIYFALGYFTFKYMVLYAMDQPQHATGGAWRIICYRIIIGLVVFEVVMLGWIALLSAFVQSVCILPLIPFTLWYGHYIKQRFEPLTKYIALRAIRGTEDSEEEAVSDEPSDDELERPSRAIIRRGSTLDEDREKGWAFVNPSLTVPYVIAIHDSA